MQVIDTMTEEETLEWRRLVVLRDAVECCPHDLTLERAHEIMVEYMDFRLMLWKKYELDESEGLLISPVSGEIMYGVE